MAENLKKPPMKSAADYRIEEVETILLNDKKVKAFKAFVKKGDDFEFMGAYTAPVRTANKSLWLIPNESAPGCDD